MESIEPKPLIAIVDDDPLVRRAIKRLVHASGIDAVRYAGGAQFLATLDRFPSTRPDCLVLDVGMPDMSGLDVLKYLAAWGHRIPVIMITGGDADLILNEALSYGAIMVFQKPLEPELFVEAVRALGPGRVIRP